jgi:hypothetical protein
MGVYLFQALIQSDLSRLGGEVWSVGILRNGEFKHAILQNDSIAIAALAGSIMPGVQP